jgi:hypothetical protein
MNISPCSHTVDGVNRMVRINGTALPVYKAKTPLLAAKWRIRLLQTLITHGSAGRSAEIHGDGSRYEVLAGYTYTGAGVS